MNGFQYGGFVESFKVRRSALILVGPVVWCAFFFLIVPQMLQAQDGRKHLGGPTGRLRAAAWQPLEGIMVQLVSQKNSIRTTVYANSDGQYEFPKLEAGVYTLRIPRPMEFQPYVRNGVQIDGATQLEEIVLERVSGSAGLPPTPEIAAQLTGAEWMWNLPGTGLEKWTLGHLCGFGCHSYQQIFRARFDESGWRLIVDRMTRGAGSPLINLAPESMRAGDTKEQKDSLVKWLARVRGPESEDPPFVAFPRPSGKANRVIVTEYELPRLELATHDVWGDSEGYLWYSPHRSSYIGRLDPRTGAVKEYHIPATPGALPGTHWIWVDKNDIVWASENWAHSFVRLDPKTEQVKKIPVDVKTPINSPMGGNHAISPDGFIWKCRDQAVIKINPNTGAEVHRYPLKKVHSAYGSAISWDGNFFGGGAWPEDGVILLDIRSGEVMEFPTSLYSGPRRGGFDPQGNYWAGLTSGGLVKVDPKTRRVREYPLPTPYASLYEATADKNGEIWAADLHGGRFLRFNPRTEEWVVYVLPEPYSHNRKTYIDNSTDPVTVWYVDHHGYLVRLQPLE